MGLLQLFVLHCVLLVVNAETTLPPTPTTASDVQNEVSSSSPPEQEYNISSCLSDKDSGSRFVLQGDFLQWFEALAACARRGMRLAVPRSPQEAAALGELLFAAPDRPLPSGDIMLDAMFVGVHNIDQATHWHTLDGSLLSEAGYDLWLEGGAGECGALLGDGRYVRQPCHSRMRFACESPGGGGAATAQRRAAGYEALGDADAGRFRLYEEPLAWALALRRCEAEGATLAVPASPRHAGLLAGALFARANARLLRHGFFVGITDVAQEGDWRTVAGVSLDAAGYSTWKPGEPSHSRRENCGVLLKDGRFADRSCSEPMAYCCQETVAPRDSEGRVETRGRYRLHHTPLTWFEAVLACQRENATLVTPNLQEREFVKNMMYSDTRDMYGNRVLEVSYIHVGIYDSFGNQTWRSINDESQTPTQNMNYSKRGRHYRRIYNEYGSSERYDYDDSDNQPLTEMFSVSIEQFGQKCVKMNYNGNFQNEICSEKLAYLCKRRE